MHGQKNIKSFLSFSQQCKSHIRYSEYNAVLLGKCIWHLNDHSTYIFGGKGGGGIPVFVLKCQESTTQ